MKIPNSSILKMTAAASAIALALSGCSGSSSSDSTDSGTTTSSVTITAVDPYITGAEFYADVNGNGQYDAGTDKLSTAGSTDGTYIFSNYEPSSSVKIYARSNGKHNGVTFNIALKGEVSAKATTAVLNPATTATTGLNITAAQLVNILNQFSSDIGTTLTEADITGDPVKGLADKTIASLTSEEIAKIRAQVALTGLQRVMQGSTEIQKLTGTQFYTSATTSTEIIYKIVQALVTAVKSGINQTNINGFLNDSGYQAIVNAGAPQIKTSQFLKMSVTIMDRITEAGYTACNTYNAGKTSATWNAADNMTAISNAVTPLMSSINTWGATLGPSYYAADSKATIEALPQGSTIIANMTTNNTNTAQKNALQAGLNCTSKYFQINSSNQIVCVQ